MFGRTPQVLDEINEVSDQMRQIQDVFQAPLGMGADMDEDELLGELEELEASELDKELLEPAPVPATRVRTGVGGGGRGGGGVLGGHSTERRAQGQARVRASVCVR